ncbi:MAG: Gldg family protein [Planctomycetota bacterium]
MDPEVDFSQVDINLQIAEFVYMLVVDLMFLVALVFLMLPLGIWRQAAFAVMKRNFVGYFSNPTGYVFLCLFVLLTSFAAFWPHEFFTTNLANFDQLNQYLPYIMLIFIPAITMSIWAEERRQGTDELLLTLPAKDFDIVIGKYFAAVLVFTVSLLFSQLSNYTVLLWMTGGELDNLLLFSTYLGYWFMGIAMISLGMVASFLTNNLTVGFIFGAAFNAPLAFFSDSDVILSDGIWIQRLFDWSLLQRFEPFGRGLISMPSIFYFLGIVVIGVYLSLILIGRRHWLGGRDGTSLFWHFIVRAGLVVVMTIAAVLIVQHSPLNQVRVDISDQKINTLAPATIAMLDRLKSEDPESTQPINVEAFISNNIPPEFVRMKYDLVNLLREFDALGGNRVNVNLRQEIGPFSEEANQAEKKYGIRPVTVRSEQRGAVREEDIVLGIAFSGGIERIVIPFMNYGVPVEYELMRSINTVSQSERKKIGIVQTDILPFGGTIVQEDEQPVAIRKLRIIEELEKQYDVQPVDAMSPIPLFEEDENGKPIGRRFDVLMVFQPSMTTSTEMTNILDAMRSGQPTAIFEDPLPNQFRQVRGSMMPRLLTRNGNDPAEIQNLWNVLDLRVARDATPIVNPNTNQPVLLPRVAWQLPDRNPYPRNQTLSQPEHLVIQQTSQRDARFSITHPATQGIDQLYFQFAGFVEPEPSSKLTFEELVNSGQAGTVRTFDLMSERDPTQLMEKRRQANTLVSIAVAIKGPNADGSLPESTDDVEKTKNNLDVIYVADVDTIADSYMATRDAPVRNGVEYRYQNVNFVLNVVDALAGVDTYLELRNRRVKHVTLEKLEQTYNTAMQKVSNLDQELQKDYTTALAAAEKSIRESTEDLEERIKRALQAKTAKRKYDPRRLAAEQNLLQQRRREQATKFTNKRQELENKRQEEKRKIDLEAEQTIQEAQRYYKLAAVIIPPIPPLLVGLFVFARGRLREREGISKARRLK